MNLELLFVGHCRLAVKTQGANKIPAIVTASLTTAVMMWADVARWDGSVGPACVRKVVMIVFPLVLHVRGLKKLYKSKGRLVVPFIQVLYHQLHSGWVVFRQVDFCLFGFLLLVRHSH